jgi:hypothetical protein
MIEGLIVLWLMGIYVILLRLNIKIDKLTKQQEQ